MRVLVSGQGFAYAAEGYVSAHGVEARDLGLARGLAALGHDVHLAATTTGLVSGTTAGRVLRVPWGAIPDTPGELAATYDAIVCSEITGWWNIGRRSPRHVEAVRAHPRVVGALDSWHPEAAWMRAIGLTTVAMVRAVSRLHPRAFFLPWGVAEVPEDVPSPWPGARPRVVYIGCVHPRYLDVLNALAEDDRWETWVAGLFLSSSGAWGGLTDTERRERCSSRLRFVSDVTGRLHSGHGPVTYGRHLPSLAHASVGINLAAKPEPYEVINSKILDYLGAGLPIVTEPGAGNITDVVACDAGRCVPYGDVAAMREAIARELAAPRDRARIRGEARRLGTWNDVAKMLEEHLCD